MIGAIRRLLAIPDMADTDSVSLEAAIAEQRRRKTQLTECEAALERARDAVRAADEADRELETAEAAAATAAAEWAASGAKDQPAGDVFERASRARDNAYRTRLKADGVKNAIPRLESDVGTARIALEPCAERIHNAAAAIIATSMETELAKTVDDFWVWFKRYTRLCALRNLLRRNTPGSAWYERMHPEPRMARSPAHGRMAELLGALPVREPHPDDSLPAAAQFVREFRRLVEGTDV